MKRVFRCRLGGHRPLDMTQARPSAQERRRAGRMGGGRIRAAVLFVFAASLVFRISAAQAERRADSGPNKLFYELKGKGSPLVVIDVGVGESFRAWTSIAAEVAKVTAVLVYDRAGYGRSEPGRLPRDAKSEVSDLWGLLETAALKGPFVLVGHSLGGLNMQVFGHEHPESVAGMVLCDPPPRDWLAGGSFPKLRQLFVRTVDEFTRAAERAERSSDPAERKRAPFLRTLSSEHKEMFGNTAKQVLSILSFGTMRVIVIAAGRSNPAFGEEADAFQRYWIEENRKLSRLSPEGEFVLAERSGHQLHRDAPGVVLSAIRKLVGAAVKDRAKIKENER